MHFGKQKELRGTIANPHPETNPKALPLLLSDYSTLITVLFECFGLIFILKMQINTKESKEIKSLNCFAYLLCTMGICAILGQSCPPSLHRLSNKGHPKAPK